MQVHDTVRERFLRRNGLANCAFSVAVERAGRALRAARFESLIVDDFTDPVRRHEAVEFRWSPRLALLPAAQALLTVRPHAPQGTELQLSLAYIPPLGGFGSVFDLLVGRHIGWLTAGLLLVALRRAVERSTPA